MYFSIFHSYFDEENILRKKEEEICIVCWDSQGITDDLKNLINEQHICCYNGKFHKDCLYKWFNKNNYCPMCREKINVSAFLNNNKNTNLEIVLGKTVQFLFFFLRYCYIITYVFMIYLVIYSISGVIIKIIF